METLAAPLTLISILKSLSAALPTTLYVAGLAIFFTLIFGTLLAYIRMSKPKGIDSVIRIYVSIIRSTPIILQMFLVYYGIPWFLTGVGIDINHWSKITFAVLALVLHNAVYFSEIIIPAYLSVDAGQHEAADSMGFHPLQKVFRIIGPQVVPIALPSVCSLFITLIKDSSILFVIGVIELTGAAKNFISNHYGQYKIEVFLVLALMYWLISILVEISTKHLERLFPVR